MATRFLLIDDHPLVREGLALALTRVTDEVEVLEAESAERGLELIRNHNGTAGGEGAIDMIVLDLELPGLSGLAAVDAILVAAVGVPVVILAGRASVEVVSAVFAKGVSGFVPKSLPSAQLLLAFEFVFAGGRYVPPEFAISLSSSSSPLLTPRQKCVLRMLARGETTREIASALGLADATVRVHIQAVVKALGAKNREEALVSPRVAEILGL